MVPHFRQQIQTINTEEPNFCTANYFPHKFRDEFQENNDGKNSINLRRTAFTVSKLFHEMSFDHDISSVKNTEDTFNSIHLPTKC